MEEKKFEEPVAPYDYSPTEEQLEEYHHTFIEDVRNAYRLQDEKPKSILDKIRSLYVSCFKEED